MNKLVQLWQTAVGRRGSQPAIIEADSGRIWTMAEVAAEAQQRAERLPLHVRGQWIAFCLPNSAEWFVRFLVVQHRRAAAVPLDPSLTSEAQEYAARALGAQFLWGQGGLRRLGRTTKPLRSVCCIKATSGTSGKPKAIPCPAGHLVSDGRNILRTMGIRAADRNLASIPLGHSYGLGNLVMPLLMQGTAVVCAQTFVPRQILQLIGRHEVTVFPTVPAVLRALAQLDGVTKPPSLRLVISAGGPLSPDVARQFDQRYGIKVRNFYGSSETGGICYDRTGNAGLSGRSVGKPLAGVTVRVRRDGRVAVCGAGSATLPDLGEWNRYGELRLLGRVGQVANIAGKKVTPLEVERALRGLPGIRDVWVTVLKDRHGDDFLAAAVETERERHAIEMELRQSLPAWKLPKAFHLAASLPRSDRGKVHTEELKARLSVSLP
ncbi:MAG TPA: fatty acid--CoA ligase family protein [Verrucomicrobiae bacterium]|nr:fatty acid--CoA ligase family protein [Verrucomicrobiae bacterium]